MSTAFCTIIAMNYLPVARVLARSVARHHPEVTMYMVVVDRPDEAAMLPPESFTVLPIDQVDLGNEDYRLQATMYDVTEFSTSIKPRVLSQLLRSHDTVLYLDPDTRLYARLDDLIGHTSSAGWSVTPHCTEPIPRTGAGPDEREIMGAGIYNLGYIGVTRSAGSFLDWWWERLRRNALALPAEQMFTDQRWVDLAVPIFSPHIEKSTSYNVAYWNLDQRRLWFDGDTPMVDDEPLRFFHFSGYDPDEPWWLSKYQRGRARVLMSDNPAYERLFETYREELLAERKACGPKPTYGWNAIVPGLPFHTGLRRLYREEFMEAERLGLHRPPSPFVDGELDSFLEWLGGPDHRRGRGIPRHVSAIIDDEDSLRGRFHHVGDHNRADLLHWIRNEGVAKYRSLTMLGAGVAEAPTAFVKDSGRRSRGVDVIGYLTADLGVGQAGRHVARALTAAGVDVSLSAWSRTPSRLGDTSMSLDQSAGHDTVFLAVNADQLPILCGELGQGFFRGRRVVSQWFWELEQAPPWFRPAMDHVDELWAPTRFIESTMRSVAPRRVHIRHMPLPIEVPAVSTGPSDIGEGGYCFLFVFDFLSVMKRKNPLGLVRAFREAFPREGEARLVIKTINASARAEDAERLRWAIRDRGDIRFIDGYHSHAEVSRMIADADCYVSLHRSEGLGLTMAEAMALGKPVVATAYSGNMDFMNEDTARLVPWTLVEVGKGAEAYPANAKWAEPDVEAAARMMRELQCDPVAGRSLGERARNHVLGEFSVQRVGERMAARLGRGGSARRGR